MEQELYFIEGASYSFYYVELKYHLKQRESFFSWKIDIHIY